MSAHLHAPREMRLDLARFACRVAWLDGPPPAAVRRLVRSLAERWELPPHERFRVAECLATGRPAEGFDLARLPRDRLRLYLDVASAIAAADPPGSDTPGRRRVIEWLRAEIARPDGGAAPAA